MEVKSDTFVRSEGPTPNGGAYAIAQFSKGDGQAWEPCPKDEATRVEIIEYDEQDREIMQTIGSIR